MPSSPPTTTTLPSSVFNRWAKALRVVKEGSRLQEEGSEGDQEWQAPVTCQNNPLEILSRLAVLPPSNLCHHTPELCHVSRLRWEVTR